MKLIDHITVYHNAEPRFIQLYQGDLTQLSEQDAVDILVVSAFPGDYNPIPGTLIGALSHHKGVSVGNLAKDKEADLRESFSCWLSKEVTSEANFRRILCFEPLRRDKNVPEVVGDIFQSLIAFLSNSESLQDIAMPLVATGSQMASKQEILSAIVEAAVNWLGLGLPVKHIKIAIYNQSGIEEIMQIFPQLKEKYNQSAPKVDKVVDDYQYDVFVSYSHQNTAEANHLVSLLKELDSKLRIFIDRKELNVGSAWQQQIYDALDSCRKVVALYSEDYLNSKVCKEEFNIALYRDRDSEENVLFPIYLYSADLPTYMKVLQYLDCREGDQNKLRDACEKITTAESQQKLSSTATTNDGASKENVYSLIRELQTQMTATTEKLQQMQHKLDKLYQRVFDNDQEIFSMKMVDYITVYHNSQPRYIQLFHGDLSEISAEDAVDILVVSAFPGTYAPSSGTLIGALDKKNVSVGKLSLSKAADLRESFSCWISRDIDQKRTPVNFKRILCFEPLKTRQKIAEVIGDIFQSLIAFLSNTTELKKVAMPLVSTGKRRAPVSQVLPSLIEAAAQWLSLGLPVEELKITAFSEQDIREVNRIFPDLKKRYDQFSQPKTASDVSEHKYDIFISYSHQDSKEANQIVSLLKELDSELQIFIDRRELNVGCAWQQQIYDALDSCRKVIAIYSENYLNSKVCKEEFNIALYRDRDTEENILFPIYLYTAMLPTYMKVMQYIDCREANTEKLQEACADIIAELKGSKLRQVRKQIAYKDAQRRANSEILALLKNLQTQVDKTNERLLQLEQQVAGILKDKSEA